MLDYLWADTGCASPSILAPASNVRSPFHNRSQSAVITYLLSLDLSVMVLELSVVNCPSPKGSGFPPLTSVGEYFL